MNSHGQILILFRWRPIVIIPSKLLHIHPICNTARKELGGQEKLIGQGLFSMDYWLLKGSEEGFLSIEVELCIVNKLFYAGNQ
jgi:hypothetical protein